MVFWSFLLQDIHWTIAKGNDREKIQKMTVSLDDFYSNFIIKNKLKNGIFWITKINFNFKGIWTFCWSRKSCYDHIWTWLWKAGRYRWNYWPWKSTCLVLFIRRIGTLLYDLINAVVDSTNASNISNASDVSYVPMYLIRIHLGLRSFSLSASSFLCALWFNVIKWLLLSTQSWFYQNANSLIIRF